MTSVFLTLSTQFAKLTLVIAMALGNETFLEISFEKRQSKIIFEDNLKRKCTISFVQTCYY